MDITVKMLIEQLKQFDPNMIVQRGDMEGGSCSIEILQIEKELVTKEDDSIVEENVVTIW